MDSLRKRSFHVTNAIPFNLWNIEPAILRFGSNSEDVFKFIFFPCDLLTDVSNLQHTLVNETLLKHLPGCSAYLVYTEQL